MNNLKKLSGFIEYIDYLDFDDDDIEDGNREVVFMTQRDNRVDDSICLPLAGVTFRIDDPMRPIIPDDTHPNCRCYYVDKITGEIVTDISSKRTMENPRGKSPRTEKKYIKKDKKKLTKKKIELINKLKDRRLNYLQKHPEEQFKKNQQRDEVFRQKLENVHKEVSMEKIKKWLNQL